jgi:hypothetical protein
LVRRRSEQAERGPRLLLTVILSFLSFLSGSACKGIVRAITGVFAKISSDQATEFAAAASAEQTVLVARMQASACCRHVCSASLAFPVTFSILRDARFTFLMLPP